MKTNCKCEKKKEEWSFDKSLGCWYVERICEYCNYYWEGPDHSKTSIHRVPTGNKVAYRESVTGSYDCIRTRRGEFSIYCWDEDGNYGTPVSFDKPNDIFDFCELNKDSHHQIKVISSNDEICVEVINGSYTFPPQWIRFNNA